MDDPMRLMQLPRLSTPDPRKKFQQGPLPPELFCAQRVGFHRSATRATLGCRELGSTETQEGPMLADLSRRQSLKGLALFGLGASVAAPLGGKPASAQPAPSDIKDEDIFHFALNLEYMEAEYYLRATTGKGIDAADVGSNAPAKRSRE